MEGLYADVIIDISHEKVDRPFVYRIPEHLKGKIHSGMCVMVPFGRGDGLKKAYCLEVKEQTDFDPSRIKEIAGILEDEVPVEGRLIRLAGWMKEQYGSTMITALKTVIPAQKKIKQQENREVRLRVDRETAAYELRECIRKKQNAKARLLAELLKEECLPYSLLTGKLSISAPTFKSLENAGLITVQSVPSYRNPVKLDLETESGKKLSPEQAEIVDSILKEYDDGIRKTYLLKGITGSGKTEVYMTLIKQVIARGKQAIVLIPEIALTYQTLLRFYKRFGDRVSVMNSSLSEGEKYDQCQRAKRGEIDVIIGPRSALFTPFEQLGLIIIDEEHEPSYKSENMPKYHARETAIALAELCGASVLLGSATPSVESYHKALTGEYGLFRLDRRLTGGTLPAVEVVDLRQELRQGNKSIFSLRLQQLLEDRLSRGEQSMLFINRRGYAGFVSCRSCGEVIKCPHCDVSLSEHKNGRMICHYCGYEQPSVKLCPSCGSRFIGSFKAGTEAIEEQLRIRFPGARVLRMDADTTRKKDSYDAILSAFSQGEADILLGTQMIVKGHDFPGVTLMGVLAADLSLGMGDYRAGERTFQLLTQAAGRAGRGEKPGNVVIQTYQPEHYSIVHASHQDYESFYREEILYRKMLQYPPAAHVMAVQIFAALEERGQQLAEILKHEAEQSPAAERRAVRIIGPAPAGISKINDIYRYVIYVKSPSYRELVELKDRLEKYLNAASLRSERVQFDFDPMNAF